MFLQSTEQRFGKYRVRDHSSFYILHMAAATMVIDNGIISWKDADQPVLIADAGAILESAMLLVASPMSTAGEQKDHQ